MSEHCAHNEQKYNPAAASNNIKHYVTIFLWDGDTAAEVVQNWRLGYKLGGIHILHIHSSYFVLKLEISKNISHSRQKKSFISKLSNFLNESVNIRLSWKYKKTLTFFLVWAVEVFWNQHFCLAQVEISPAEPENGSEKEETLKDRTAIIIWARAHVELEVVLCEGHQEQQVCKTG